MDDTRRSLKKIQLDEDINDRRIEKACAAEGLVQALRFPSNLKGMKDPKVFRALFPKGNVVVTTDRGFVSDHLDEFPDVHPGVVIVSFDDDAIPTMTTQAAQKIIRNFKADFPEWHQTEWQNSVVNISPSHLSVWHVDSGELISDLFSSRANDPWRERLTSVLILNAKINESSA